MALVPSAAIEVPGWASSREALQEIHRVTEHLENSTHRLGRTAEALALVELDLARRITSERRSSCSVSSRAGEGASTKL
jgi:hypothetical protein